MSRSAKRHNRRREHNKAKKQESNLLLLNSTSVGANCCKKFSISYLKKNVVVFDGGLFCETAPTLNPDVPGWSCHKIKEGSLQVCNPNSSDMGLIYKEGSDNYPRFILFPRKEALAINKDGRQLCEAMKNVSKTNNNVVRGKSKEVFGLHKYCCVGSKNRR